MKLRQVNNKNNKNINIHYSNTRSNFDRTDFNKSNKRMKTVENKRNIMF